MRFTTEERIAAPADWVFARIADPGAVEGAARRRGVRIERTPERAPDGGHAWRAAFEFRGMRREADLAMTPDAGAREIALRGESAGLTGQGTARVVPDGPDACRLAVDVELSAGGLTGRAFLQSLKLARGRIQDRFARRVEDTAHALSKRRAGGPRA